MELTLNPINSDDENSIFFFLFLLSHLIYVWAGNTVPCSHPSLSKQLACRAHDEPFRKLKRFSFRILCFAIVIWLLFF